MVISADSLPELIETTTSALFEDAEADRSSSTSL